MILDDLLDILPVLFTGDPTKPELPDLCFEVRDFEWLAEGLD